jgi:hypothetical protein
METETESRLLSRLLSRLDREDDELRTALVKPSSTVTRHLLTRHPPSTLCALRRHPPPRGALPLARQTLFSARHLFVGGGRDGHRVGALRGAGAGREPRARARTITGTKRNARRGPPPTPSRPPARCARGGGAAARGRGAGEHRSRFPGRRAGRNARAAAVVAELERCAEATTATPRRAREEQPRASGPFRSQRGSECARRVGTSRIFATWRP